ncbi:MAG: hypothetical protein OXE99_11095 [Cellvibrionales bacterium]|nr:hypothetical protein [Cellvibrionales bacterium]
MPRILTFALCLSALLSCKDGFEQKNDSKADINLFSVSDVTVNSDRPAEINSTIQSGVFPIRWNITSSDPYHVSLYITQDPEKTLTANDRFFRTACGSDTNACTNEGQFLCTLSNNKFLACEAGTEPFSEKNIAHLMSATKNPVYIILEACNTVIDLCNKQAIVAELSNQITADSDPDAGLSGGEKTFSVSSTPAVDLSDAVSLTQFEYHLAENLNPNIFHHQGGSNLLAYNSSEIPYAPINNVEPIYVHYSVVSEDGNTVYLSVNTGSDSDDHRRSLAHNILLDDPNLNLNLTTPLIGPVIDLDFPLSIGQLQNTYGEEATFTYTYSEPQEDICPSNTYEAPLPENPDVPVCVESIAVSIDGVTKFIDALSLMTAIQNSFLTTHEFCAMLEYDRTNNSLSCLGGTQLVNAQTKIAGLPLAIQVRIPFIEPDNKDFTKFDNIRKGLRPLQIDPQGNRYLISHNYEKNHSLLHKISPANDISLIDVSVTDKMDSFVIFNENSLVYGFNALSPEPNKLTDKGLKIFHEGQLMHIPASSRYYQNYQVDTHSTLLADGYLIKAFGNEGYAQVPLTWDDRNVNDVRLDSPNRVLGCVENDQGDTQLVSVLPFEEQPILNGTCHYHVAGKNHLLTIITGDNGDHIHIRSLIDQSEQNILHAQDASDETFRLHKLHLDDSRVYFTGVRTSPTAEAIAGEINLEALSNHAVDFWKIHNIHHHVDITNRVTDFHIINNEAATAETPRIDAWYMHPYEPSHIGMGFSQLMDEASVMHTTQVEGVDTMPFWHHEKLFLIAASEGLNDSEQQKVGGDPKPLVPAYAPFKSGQEYVVTTSASATPAKGRNGLSLSEENATLTSTFAYKNAFYHAKANEAFADGLGQGYAGILAKPGGSSDKNYHLVHAKTFDYWGAYGTEVDTASRYFNVLSFDLGHQSYRFQFDMLNTDGKHRWGLAVANQNVTMTPNSVGNNAHQLWNWQFALGENPLDTSAAYVHTDVKGFSVYGKGIYQYPSGSFVEESLIDNSDEFNNFWWQRIRLDIHQNQMQLYLLDIDGETWKQISQQSFIGLDTSKPVNLWLSLFHKAHHEIDNLTFSTLTNDNGIWVVEETLKSTDFENPDQPFGDFESLKKTATQDITPLGQ